MRCENETTKEKNEMTIRFDNRVAIATGARQAWR